MAVRSKESGIACSFMVKDLVGRKRTTDWVEEKEERQEFAIEESEGR